MTEHNLISAGVQFGLTPGVVLNGHSGFQEYRADSSPSLADVVTTPGNQEKPGIVGLADYGSGEGVVSLRQGFNLMVELRLVDGASIGHPPLAGSCDLTGTEKLLPE